jgi:hypothetical protein
MAEILWHFTVSQKLLYAMLYAMLYAVRYAIQYAGLYARLYATLFAMMYAIHIDMVETVEATVAFGTGKSPMPSPRPSAGARIATPPHASRTSREPRALSTGIAASTIATSTSWRSLTGSKRNARRSDSSRRAMRVAVWEQGVAALYGGRASGMA